MNTLSPEVIEWCNERLQRQSRRKPSWTPFIIDVVLSLADQYPNRPDISIVKKLWYDFQNGALPQTPMEREFP